MRQWIPGIFSASLLAAMALALCPKGRVREVTRLVCGIVCALAVADPLIKLDTDRLASAIAEYSQQAEILAEDGEEEGKMLERTYIEEECAAYICSKAAQRGVSAAGASVQARWDDEALIWVPWSAAVEAAYSAELSALIEQDLGIPAERQEWNGDEG